MFMNTDTLVTNLNNFGDYFFNYGYLIRFNDNYISYDKNKVKVTKTDI